MGSRTRRVSPRRSAPPPTATANRIIAILRRNPAMVNPVGYSVTLRTGASPRLPGDAPNVPYHVIVFGSKSRYFGWFDNGRGGSSVDLDAAGLDSTIGVNTVGYPGEMENDDAEPDQGPRIMGADEGGLEIYRDHRNFRGRPIYGGNVHVSERTARQRRWSRSRRSATSTSSCSSCARLQTHHESQRAARRQVRRSNDRGCKEFLQGTRRSAKRRTRRCSPR